MIHLAAALQRLLTLVEPHLGPIHLEALLLNRILIELVIFSAEYHEALIAQSRYLRLDADKLIRIRLT